MSLIVQYCTQKNTPVPDIRSTTMNESLHGGFTPTRRGWRFTFRLIGFCLAWMMMACAAEAADSSVSINEFMALNSSTLTNASGKYSDWIEVYNHGTTHVSMSGWYLTDNMGSLTKWRFPTGAASTIPPEGYLLVWADREVGPVTNNELHASFSLGGSGDYLALVRPDGATVVSAWTPTYPQQYDNMSYGIGLNGESRYFGMPTPGSVNAFSSPDNTVDAVKFSPKRGVFSYSIPSVTATTATAGAQIRYTTDAEPPTPGNLLYTSPLALSSTTVIRATAFQDGLVPSGIDTHTYIKLDDVLHQSNTPAGYPTNWAGYMADYGMDPMIVSNSGTALADALVSLPTLSIVTPQTNLFDPDTGIYVNPLSMGEAWEREVSAEWIDADNTSKFQIDCGLRIHGRGFRLFDMTMKKSFGLWFRSKYGPSTLKQNLFSGNSVASFDELVLRGGGLEAWNKWWQYYSVPSKAKSAQYIVDEFVRRSHLAMGRTSPHGSFIQLYLNGLYWGLYNITERISGKFAAAYYGGRDDTWDVMSEFGMIAIEGNDAAWNAMLGVLSTNQGSNETYQRVQGNNPDGSRNPAYPIYLDVDDFTDYMIVEYWSANSDWPRNNWRALRNRDDSVSTGFKFSVWDAEAGLGVWSEIDTDATADQTEVATILTRLANNPEYRLCFADRVQKHLFNGGELSPAVTIPRYQALAAGVEPAIMAESARWGDQSGTSTATVEDWRSQRDYVLNTFLPLRGAYVLQQFKDRGLYPSVDPPAFSRLGGLFTNTLSMTMTAEQPIYFTLDGTDPRQYGSGTAVGSLYTNAVLLTRTMLVKARARSTAGEWSALAEAVFTTAELPALRVTELMYHPGYSTSSSNNGFPDGDDQFIELQNSGDTPLCLADARFTQGVSFDFTRGAVTILGPGEYVLVVKSIAAFTNRYPSVPAQRIAGAFAFPSTSLDKTGEKIEIEDATGRKVVSFTYNSRWRVATAGAGHSLVALPGIIQADGELDYPGNWKTSVYIGGSPGQAEPPEPAASLLLNEILAHTDINSPPYDSNDGIELYNATASPIGAGPGWYLSDDPENLIKWAIPATNVFAAHRWRYFDEMHDFHNPITNGFGLNKMGEQVLLSYLPGTGMVDRVVDAVSFQGEENGVPWVRYPDGTTSWFYGIATPGTSNRITAAGLLIDEVMYHPKPTAAHPEDNEYDEYVELHNPTTQPIGLTNTVNDVGGAWRLAGGIGYLFPPGTVVPADGRVVVVSFDPSTNSTACAAFLEAYGLTDGQVQLLGPYSGQLKNKTDSVRLERPVNPDTPGEAISWHVLDQVTYYNAAPWPSGSDDNRISLQRRPMPGYGNEPASWMDSLAPTPGAKAAKIIIATPTNGAFFRAPFSVQVTTTLETNWVVGTVQRVDFFDDVDRLYSATSAPYAFTLNSLTNPGSHRLKAILIDAEGTSTSPLVTITIPYETTLTVTATAGGTVQPGGTIKVIKGAATELTAICDTGYAFANWTVTNGAAIIANRRAAYTTVAISAPAVLVANFIQLLCEGGTTTNYTLNGTNFMTHAFTTVGTTNINIHGSGSVEVLIVGGGGGGGSGALGADNGGGGGGGGVIGATTDVVRGLLQSRLEDAAPVT